MHAPAPQTIPFETLLLAYRSGIFPMADSRQDTEVFWVEPRQRAILPLDGFHCSHSLAKELRRERFTVTCNQAFAEVIEACAAPRPRHPESWISERIAASYRALHQAGHAHSIECWAAGHLVGGLYGVAFDRVFCGESMFSLAPNASKVAIAWLVEVLKRAGVRLLDCQFITDHLASLGAVEVTQQRYLELLAEACGGVGVDVGVEAGAGVPEAFGALLAEAATGESSPGKLIAQSLTHTS